MKSGRYQEVTVPRDELRMEALPAYDRGAGVMLTSCDTRLCHLVHGGEGCGAEHTVGFKSTGRPK